MSYNKVEDDAMLKSMTAPQQKSVTDGQIEEVVSRLRTQLWKHRDELSFEAVQEVLGTDNLGMVLFAPFRKLVEIVSPTFISRVCGINRKQNSRQALNATGHILLYMNTSIVDAMPRGEGENVELKFFELDYDPTPTELNAEYNWRALKADPFALAKYMEDDSAFTDERPVICQWGLDEDGSATCVRFSRWVDGRRALQVYHNNFRRDRCHFFAGV